MRRRLVLAGFMFIAAGCIRGERMETAADRVPVFDAADPPLTELAWVAPHADKVRILTELPGECLRPAERGETAYLVEIGRAAFSSPLLFGGQAARGGLSCSSCHRNGHDNPAFFLAGLSGAPGTADVTSSLFSKVREDGVFNPLPIPSLVGVAGKDAFGTRAPAPSLHAFIESAVTDEFQGAPPPETILRGIAAYVAHLEPSTCTGQAEARNVRRDMADAARTLTAAGEALRRGDADAADFMLVTAQNAFGRIHERFAAPALQTQRDGLASLAAELAAIRSLLSEDVETAGHRINDAIAATDRIAQDLDAHRRQSLYDVDTLAVMLTGTGEAKQ